MKVYIPGYMYEYYDGIYSVGNKREDATNVTVSDGKATVNIDFTLDAMASISGRVYRADDKRPINEASVLVYGPHFSTGPIGARTAADGSYKVISHNEGESSVMSLAEGYIPQYYDGVYLPDQATKVTTVLGKDTPGIDIYLDWGGSISGRVYQPDGITPNGQSGIFYAQVSGVKTPIPGGCLPTPPKQSLEVNPDGTYSIGGLLSGEYELLASDRNSNSSYVSEVRHISVTQGKETGNVDFVLGPRSSMSGHVYYRDSKTLAADATVEAIGWNNSYVQTDSNGYYLMEQMAPAKYLVRVTNLQSEYREVSLSAGKDTVHDIILDTGPR